MPFIADFHIHSKYSLATSREMNVESLAGWAKIKGISMLGTGDFTHPLWLKELSDKLRSSGEGVYSCNGVDFVLTAEVSNIYFKAGKTRKVHIIIFAPELSVAGEINKALSQYGLLNSNARPIIKLECDRMVKLLSGIHPDIFFVPAHVWTPHFGLFGSKSGFDSLEECFEEESGKIFAVETGLSSDPAMNWRWSKLDRLSLISNSDAHSPSKLGREANVFREKITYADLVRILKTRDKDNFLYTIEFFPEEGKYHWDGHRACNVRMSPQEAAANNNMCSSCGRKITLGVAHRIESLADRPEGFVPEGSIGFRRMVGLESIICGAMGVRAGSKAAASEYTNIVKNFGNEISLLLDARESEIRAICTPKIAQAIIDMRSGKVELEPGYDGVYGKIKVVR